MQPTVFAEFLLQDRVYVQHFLSELCRFCALRCTILSILRWLQHGLGCLLALLRSSECRCCLCLDKPTRAAAGTSSLWSSVQQA